jgi:hypothetical protein
MAGIVNTVFWVVMISASAASVYGIAWFIAHQNRD